jgi:hypothetical protein
VDKTAEDLKTRTKRFAIAILEFVTLFRTLQEPKPPGVSLHALGPGSSATTVAAVAPAHTQNSPHEWALPPTNQTKVSSGSMWPLSANGATFLDEAGC